MKILIFGNRDFAEMAHYYLRDKVSAFVVDGEYCKNSSFDGLPLIPFEDIKPDMFSTKEYVFFCPIACNNLRRLKYNQIKNKGYELTSYISDKSNVMSSKIGDNCFILENNVIQPFVTIGNNVIMWSGNHIGHHSVIEDDVFLSSHVVISGKCTIKRNCWFGVNCSVRDGVTIGEDTVVGMGSVVLENISNGVYVGVPAKKQR